MNSILLHISLEKNRRLLAETLKPYYEIVLPGPASAPADECDMIIIDGPALEGQHDIIQTKRRQRVLLPVLLVTAREDVRLITRRLWRIVDELIICPIEKTELCTRVEILLRARRYSVELAEANDAMETFANTVFHDLRAQLSIARGHAQLVRRGSSPDDDNIESLEAILLAADRMDNIVQDMLDLARLRGGGIKTLCRPVQLNAILESLMGRLKASYDVGRVCLDIAPGLPAVMADVARLERIIINLLSNALKYSSDEVTISARGCHGYAEVSVSDKGIGISPDDMEHLFDSYHRFKGDDGHRESVGLGLYITRAIVEAQGGVIKVDSRPGAGSTFTFTLPISA